MLSRDLQKNMIEQWALLDDEGGAEGQQPDNRRRLDRQKKHQDKK